MARRGDLTGTMMALLREQLGERIDDYTFPPPVFTSMEGELLEIDVEAGVLVASFPVRPGDLNPYGAMQGGMIAAAIDNALGPLSMLIAPPNVTRRLELTYSRPATPDVGRIVVTANLVERQGRRLFFKAVVRGQEGRRLARAKAMHWVLDGE